MLCVCRDEMNVFHFYLIIMSFYSEKKKTEIISKALIVNEHQCRISFTFSHLSCHLATQSNQQVVELVSISFFFFATDCWFCFLPATVAVSRASYIAFIKWYTYCHVLLHEYFINCGFVARFCLELLSIFHII